MWFWDFWICGKWFLGHFKNLKCSTNFWIFNFSIFFLSGGYRPPNPPPWKSELIDSVLKLLLYGTRFRMNYCPPGNIGNWGLQHSPESWESWKTIFLIQSYPGNVGKRIFSTFSYPGNIGKRIFSTSSYPENIGWYDPYSVLSWKYWIVWSIY